MLYIKNSLYPVNIHIRCAKVLKLKTYSMLNCTKDLFFCCGTWLKSRFINSINIIICVHKPRPSWACAAPHSRWVYGCTTEAPQPSPCWAPPDSCGTAPQIRPPAAPDGNRTVTVSRRSAAFALSACECVYLHRQQRFQPFLVFLQFLFSAAAVDFLKSAELLCFPLVPLLGAHANAHCPPWKWQLHAVDFPLVEDRTAPVLQLCHTVHESSSD